MRLACSWRHRGAEDKIREVSRDWIVRDFMVKSTDFILSVMGSHYGALRRRVTLPWKLSGKWLKGGQE